jgi:hypothetical protein
VRPYVYVTLQAYMGSPVYLTMQPLRPQYMHAFYYYYYYII